MLRNFFGRKDMEKIRDGLMRSMDLNMRSYESKLKEIEGSYRVLLDELHEIKSMLKEMNDK